MAPEVGVWFTSLKEGFFWGEHTFENGSMSQTLEGINQHGARQFGLARRVRDATFGCALPIINANGYDWGGKEIIRKGATKLELTS